MSTIFKDKVLQINNDALTQNLESVFFICLMFFLFFKFAKLAT